MSAYLILKEEIPSDGYLLRPYTQVNGQKKGYHWEVSRRGFWRSFISLNKANFTYDNTGN